MLLDHAGLTSNKYSYAVLAPGPDLGTGLPWTAAHRPALPDGRPGAPEPGHWELLFAGYASAQAGTALGGAPQLEFNYGASENLQLSLSPQMTFALSGGAGA